MICMNVIAPYTARPVPARSSARAGVSRPQAHPGDAVRLSPQAQQRQAQDTLLEETYAKIASRFSEHGIDVDEGVGFDWSPEATADRIVAVATSFLPGFVEQNADLDRESLLTAYEERIRSAIGDGVGDALEILKGMSASDEVIATAEKTHALVGDKLTGFFAAQRAGSDDNASAASPAGQG